MNETTATLVNSQSGQTLAQVAILGDPIQADALFGSGSLHSFFILSGKRKLYDAWFHQQSILLRTDQEQQLIKIVTYPAQGENQAFFEIVEGTKEDYRSENTQSPHPTRKKFARGLAFVQTLLNA